MANPKHCADCCWCCNRQVLGEPERGLDPALRRGVWVAPPQIFSDNRGRLNHRLSSYRIIIMKETFFLPAVGKYYVVGVKGKKILVVGASFYCNKKDCKFFKDCTNHKRKNSSRFDECCPEYAKFGSDVPLHNEPQYAIKEGHKTYKNFASVMSKVIGCGSDNVWDYLAFTNYVQFFVPTTTTYKSYLSERHFDAFVETVRELKPDIVVIWGCVINKRLKQKNKFVIDKELLHDNGGYVCHMKLPDDDRTITLINPYHPSSSYWYGSIDTFSKYMGEVLAE